MCANMSPLFLLGFKVERMIPTERADSIGRIRTKRILGQQRVFVVRTDFPQPIGSGCGIVAELRFAFPQCFLGAFAPRQIEHECDALVTALFKCCPTDQYGHTATVFSGVFLFERIEPAATFLLFYS